MTGQNLMKITLSHVYFLFSFSSLAVINFKAIIFSKVKKIFSKITIIVFSLLMSIQMIAIIRNYFDFEIVTRFDV